MHHQNPGIPAQSPDQTLFESHEKVIQKVTHWTCEHSKGCKSVNCHRNGPKLGPIRLNHRSEHSALRAWTPVARTAPLWSQMGMPSPCPDSISLLQNCISATPCTKSPPRSFPQSLESACTGCTKFNLGTPDTFCRAVAPLTSEPSPPGPWQLRHTHMCSILLRVTPAQAASRRHFGSAAREPESPRARELPRPLWPLNDTPSPPDSAIRSLLSRCERPPLGRSTRPREVRGPQLLSKR